MPRILESIRGLQRRGGPGTAAVSWKGSSYRRRQLKPYWPGLEEQQETSEFDFDHEDNGDACKNQKNLQHSTQNVTNSGAGVLVVAKSPDEEPKQSDASVLASSKRPVDERQHGKSWTPQKTAGSKNVKTTQTSKGCHHPALVTPALLSETTVVSDFLPFVNRHSASDEWKSPEGTSKKGSSTSRQHDDREDHDAVLTKLKEQHERELHVLKEAYESILQKRQDEHATSEREWKRQRTEKDRELAYLLNQNAKLVQREGDMKTQQGELLEELRRRPIAATAETSNFSQESQQFGDHHHHKTAYFNSMGIGGCQDERFVLHEMIHNLTNELVKYQQDFQKEHQQEHQQRHSNKMSMKRFFQQMHWILLMVNQRDARLHSQVQEGLEVQFQVIRDRFEMKQKTACLEQLIQQTITCCHQKQQVQTNVALPRKEEGSIIPKKLVLKRAHKPWSNKNPKKSS